MGITTVNKKVSGELRKILPLVAQGYLFGPPRRPFDLGLFGGTARAVPAKTVAAAAADIFESFILVLL